MCGRFVQSASADDYARYFGADIVKTERIEANYNVAPTDRVLAVAEHDGDRILGSFGWGLVPHWSKDRGQAARFINARAETVAEKPAFRDSFRTKRCLIPADGFYEWTRRGDLKIPHLIFIGTHAPMALAGVWASWKDPATDEWVRTCSIITTRPNDFMRPIHDRMPALLPEPTWDVWLDRDNDDTEQLRALLVPPPESLLETYEVSTEVNSVRNNGPELILPV
ncbi:MAG: SOS response-associated peptidase [Acidimicrobiia bacterium]|nr:SOS response-associated peptidase [Acidimicrobiia bacterium]MBT8192312.1 SOS response-associated peptidase [Acidimicrobiia bacterium]NNF87892.1 SOS response-associated peptidase [Acidimicrobiia bacterium]NNL14606.1 SOS response-associated peptidase [Acidimicrobiia bacterium]RZV42500.1 MAG: SOS response-associated peptidase [Acidimicrobiia bacterium]